MQTATSLAPGLTIYQDVIQVGCLDAGNEFLLIGLGEGSFLGNAIPVGKIRSVLLTHHHRDEASAWPRITSVGSELWVPSQEYPLFGEVETFWADLSRQYHRYNFHPTNLTHRESMPIGRRLLGGESLHFGDWQVDVLDTPGHTDGSLSYLVTGHDVHVAFVGDLLYGPGQIWNLYDLQGRLCFSDGGQSQEYHGFGERVEQLLDSLDRVLAQAPDCLVPSHGLILREPESAVALLRSRLEEALASYRSTSAGRWYFPQAKQEWRDAQVGARQNLRDLPGWVYEPGGTSRAIRADDGNIFLIDCAGNMPQTIRSQQADAHILGVDGLWITHYHDDHVEQVNAFRAEQGCPVIAHERMASTLRHPEHYLMPCLHHEPIELDRTVQHGESWIWKGFRLTAYDFPGQTAYDAALLVERDGVSVLFTGDSFTPGGMDDYCCFNRDLVGEGFGYFRCLDLLDEIKPTLLVNQHVAGAFTLSRQERQRLRSRLEQRTEIYRALFPWQHPNQGLDHRWIAGRPYSQQASAGTSVRCALHAINYSNQSQPFHAEIRLPDGWQADPGRSSTEVTPGAEGALTFQVSVPADASPGRYVLGFLVAYGETPLGEIAEVLIDLTDLPGRNCYDIS